VNAFVGSMRVCGLIWLTLGIFLEKPAFLAVSIAFLALATPLRDLLRRLGHLRFEFGVLLSMLAWQSAAGGTLNALVVLIYLLGLTCGLFLPDPRSIRRAYWLPWMIGVAVLTFAAQNDVLTNWGLLPAESAFGVNVDEYAIDLRSLSYAAVIMLLYLAPHFRSGAATLIHQVVMAVIAALGSNKFGAAFSLLKNLPLPLVAPVLLVVVGGMGGVGYAHIDATAARAALWSDFAANIPRCDRVLGVCTDLILVNNEEGVRSFHSLVLDFGWYGGPLGMVAALALIWRVATVRSLYGRSAGLLFSLALLFGFPPFFNERHVLACYAFFILFQEGRPARVSGRPLREDRNAPRGTGGIALVRKR
jgi:hypothetical protein